MKSNVVYDAEFLQLFMDRMDEKGYPVLPRHKNEARTQIQAVFDIITEQLAMGRSVSRQGFGKFEDRYRQARSGRNPQNGDKLELPASVSVGFKPGKALREAVRNVSFDKTKSGKLVARIDD